MSTPLTDHASEPKVWTFFYGSYAHAQEVLGERYLPHPVLAATVDGRYRPAFCYIAPSMEPRTPERDYVERVLAPAREYGFPAWYVARLEGFRP